MTLTYNELRLLRMLSRGKVPIWGAWVGACLESLRGSGLIDGHGRVTTRGAAVLDFSDGSAS